MKTQTLNSWLMQRTTTTRYLRPHSRERVQQQLQPSWRPVMEQERHLQLLRLEVEARPLKFWHQKTTTTKKRRKRVTLVRETFKFYYQKYFFKNYIFALKLPILRTKTSSSSHWPMSKRPNEINIWPSLLQVGASKKTYRFVSCLDERKVNVKRSFG